MRTLYLLIFSIFLIQVCGYAQMLPLMPKYYQPIDSSALANNQEKEEKKSETLMKQHEKFSYSVSIGTGFSSFGNNMSMMSSYISPSVNYQVNSKLNVAVNGHIMQNSMNGIEGKYGAGAQYSYNSSPTNYGISGTVFYQLSDRLSIYGDGAYFENQSIFNDYRAQVYDTDYKTVSVGVGYKVNDKFELNFQYRYSNGLDPAYNYMSPYTNPALGLYRNNRGYWGY